MSTAAAATTAATAATVVVGGAVMVGGQGATPAGIESSTSAVLSFGSGSAGIVSPPASVAPVVEGLEQADAASLIKAAGLAEQAVKAERKAAELACPPNRAGFGAVKPFVATAGYFLRCTFGVNTIIGVASRSGASDHPLGLALDFMVNRGTGDALADCALRNKAAMGINYVIWRQRINYGSGWQPMSDRGGATANHMDHVHISFAGGPGGGSPRCGVST